MHLRPQADGIERRLDQRFDTLGERFTERVLATLPDAMVIAFYRHLQLAMTPPPSRSPTSPGSPSRGARGADRGRLRGRHVPQVARDQRRPSRSTSVISQDPPGGEQARRAPPSAWWCPAGRRRPRPSPCRTWSGMPDVEAAPAPPHQPCRVHDHQIAYPSRRRRPQGRGPLPEPARSTPIARSTSSITLTVSTGEAPRRRRPHRVADPPITDPPVTDPPVTDPPVTDLPVTDPPVTDPPVMVPRRLTRRRLPPPRPPLWSPAPDPRRALSGAGSAGGRGDRRGQEVAQQVVAAVGEDRLGVELHALGRRASRWRRPMTSPSSVSAVISSTSGTVSRSTTSEW